MRNPAQEQGQGNEGFEVAAAGHANERAAGQDHGRKKKYGRLRRSKREDQNLQFPAEQGHGSPDRAHPVSSGNRPTGNLDLILDPLITHFQAEALKAA